MRELLVVSMVAACVPPHGARPGSLTTVAETSQWQRTGRYDETIRLCHDFARTYDGVACEEIGQTSEHRPLLALVIRRAPDVPMVMIQGGIHAGEIEGKDAGFWFLRDVLDGKLLPGVLDKVGVVFLPVVNPDGHERFGPNNRPNQRGPEEMGFRTTGARLNMNRDFVKADTPEVAAVIGAFAKYDPVLFVDLHTTDGAKFQHDISINIAPRAPRGDVLDAPAAALAAFEVKRLTELGHLPVDFYPSFVTDDDPASGFAVGEAPPRFSQFYAAARNRLGMLVENHSWRTYKQRGISTYHALQAIFESARDNASAWRTAEQAADHVDLRGKQVPLAWENGPHTTDLAFKGYAYEKRPSEISGGTWIVYDETKPEVWNIPLRDQLVPKLTITAPHEGYIVDGGFAPMVAAELDRHHLAYRPISGALDVETYRATKVTYPPPFEGRTRPAIEGTWQHETRTLEPGAIFVPLAQPAARLVMQLLEPQLPDSLTAWGFFNAALEQKEYMESYVAEQTARELLAKDPSLKGAFDAAVAADPELAKSPGKRLDWFYRRSPAWDERVGLVPVYRTDHTK